MLISVRRLIQSTGETYGNIEAYGVLVGIVDAVNKVYTNTTVQVLSPDGDTIFGRNSGCGQHDVYQYNSASFTPDGNTDFFEILAGVLHGDTLEPYVFVIALDYAMRQAVGNESNL